MDKGWIAMDSDGEWWWFKTEPERGKYVWSGFQVEMVYFTNLILSCRRSTEERS